jgi:hypothetical protein
MDLDVSAAEDAGSPYSVAANSFNDKLNKT